MSPTPSPGLLVLPGWNDDGRQQYDALKADLQRDGWHCRRAFLPDSSWPPGQRHQISREDALRQTLDDWFALTSGPQVGPVAVLGFSFGAYIGAYLAVARPVELLVLRSPALYPDEDWWVPKDELDKRDMAAYRRTVHGPAGNGALAACARFGGDVLLVDSECDQVIPPPVIRSYEAAFRQARSVTRHTLAGADHQLTDPAWQAAYRAVAAAWLRERMGQVLQAALRQPIPTQATASPASADHPALQQPVIAPIGPVSPIGPMSPRTAIGPAGAPAAAHPA